MSRSADHYLDQMTSWFYSSVLQYGLIGWYWATWAAEGTYGFVCKSVKGLVHAHIEDVWVFVERNSIPWPTKKTVNNNHELAFYPDRMTFMTSVEVDRTERKSKIDDIVLATLLYPGGMLDLSSFFHDVRWIGSAPSPIEIVTCALLMRHELYSVESIKSYTLDVFTADGEDKRIRLSGEWALRPFQGWPGNAEDHEDEPEGGA